MYRNAEKRLQSVKILQYTKCGRSASEPNPQPSIYHPGTHQPITLATTPRCPHARSPVISPVLSGPVHHCTRGGVRVRHVTPGQETVAGRQRAERGQGAGGRPATCPRTTSTRTKAHARRSFPPSLPPCLPSCHPSRAG